MIWKSLEKKEMFFSCPVNYLWKIFKLYLLSLLFLEGETVMKVLPLSQGKYYADTCHDKRDRGDAT